MTYEEICKVLEISGKESDVFLPNEIFSDLQACIIDSSHIAYAYSYMYLTHFSYRNCKYLALPNYLDGNVMKEILGYSKSNRTMTYITKKGGLLDEIRYTETTKNFPITWKFEEAIDEKLTFCLIEDFKKLLENRVLLIPNMFTSKYPILAFDRVLKFEVEGEMEEKKIAGTFFDATSTHSVPYEVFLFCMSKKELGVIAFYLYSWLKHRNNLFEGGYDVSLSRLSEETKINRRSLIKYMNLLKGFRMIDFRHNQEFFVLGAFEEDRKATTYMTNDVSFFLEKYKPYKKMGVQLRGEYFKAKAEKEEKGTKNKAEVLLSELPF